MLIIGLNESNDQLTNGDRVHWNGYVLGKKDCHILRRALDFEAEGQRKEGRLKRT